MVMNIFLDDERNPRDVTWVKLPDCTWTIVRNFAEFKEWINKYGIPKRVAFDHDLAECHYPGSSPEMELCFKIGVIPYSRLDGCTGYDAAKWLCKYCQDNNVKFPEYYVHTMNPVGAENIIGYIKNYKRVVENDA